MVETIYKDHLIRETSSNFIFPLSFSCPTLFFFQVKHSLQYLKGDLMALILRYLLKESVKDAMK